MNSSENFGYGGFERSWHCTVCGTANREEYDFCLSCGAVRPKSAGKAAEKKNAKKPDKLVFVLIAAALILLMLLAAMFILLKDRDSGKRGSADVQFQLSAVADDTAQKPAPTQQPAPPPTQAPSPAPTPVPTSTAAPVYYILPYSDSYYYTEADLQGLSWKECTLARNEIYARHGRLFKTEEINDYFNAQSWYHGYISPDAFDASVLNEYELANVKLIADYEAANWGGSYYK